MWRNYSQCGTFQGATGPNGVDGEHGEDGRSGLPGNPVRKKFKFKASNTEYAKVLFRDIYWLKCWLFNGCHSVIIRINQTLGFYIFIYIQEFP